MKAAALALLLALVTVPVAAARPHSTIRIHAETNQSSGPSFSTTLQLFGRTVTMEKMQTISEEDVSGVRIYRASDGTHGAVLELNEHGRVALDTVSIDRRGSRLFVFINARAVTELQIDRRVSDGKIYLPSGLTPSDVRLLRKDWPVRK